MSTVRRRLLLLLLPAFAVLMVAGGLVDYIIASATTRNAYDRALASVGAAVAASLRSEAGQLVYEPSQQALSNGRPTLLDGAPFSITGPDGAQIAGSATLPAAAGATAAGTAFADVQVGGRRLRVATLAVHTALGLAHVTVAETLERRARSAWVMLYGKLLVDFAELDLTLILIWFAVYYGLQPLRRLHDQVEAHTPRELQRFDEGQVPGEVRPLVRAFNRLLELLNDAAAAQRRFVADAAHQMRTPVAGLLAQLELLLAKPTAAPIAAELATLNRGIEQVAHSANQLLALARAEPFSTQTEHYQAVSLPGVIQGLIERNIDRAERFGLDLGAELSPAQVDGDAFLLEDLISNLLDNALKYTPRGGRVTTRCGTGTDGGAYLEVQDNGPGIPDEDRMRVRERFYRRPGSVGTGCGLGLAIVEQIAHAHRAVLRIDAAPGGGTLMQIHFSRPVT